ncbi:hypothetical protein SAMN05192580_3708 [Sphingomonas jatrophae]|uniref:Uncharacterized protein n=1 Tax=Sphingomonas jatrophae TaxID=1166337 RepID=A0A1I6M9E3_9SPHN|nr:hypothetical protein SAMN05192580_3708 [Sphingomonas jatrophae]
MIRRMHPVVWVCCTAAMMWAVGIAGTMLVLRTL